MRKFVGICSIVVMVALATSQIARDVLSKFASVEFAAKTLTASCTEQHVSATAAGVSSESFTVSLAKPNKARIDTSEQLIVADGTTITTYDKAGKTFMKKAQSDAELKALFACNELSLFGAFFDPDFFSKVQGSKLAKKSRRGTTYDVVETSIELDGKQTASFFIDPADKLLKVGEFTAVDAAEKETVVITAKELAVDGEQGADTFTFKAPEGARELTVADLAKANTFTAPPIYFEKALETWHLRQTDERGNFPGGGNDYCAPTASTNALAYLGLHGYPKLFQGDEVAALGLVGNLASANYMGTIPGEGTNPGHVIAGLTKYIAEKGYALQSLGFQGWRFLERPVRHYRVSDSLDLDWLRRGIATPNSAVLLNLGWYVDDGNGTYRRISGHWITAVGYGSNGGGGEPDPYLLIVHDPAKHNRVQPDDPKGWLPLDSIKLVPLSEGTLTGSNQTGLPRPARGLCEITGPGLTRNSKANRAILDGALVIVLRPAK